jgi:uncharacterized coiled-coil DUF342 family protein
MNDTVHTCTQELRSKLDELNDEVKQLTTINKELKKLLKQDPYAGATLHEEVYVCFLYM